MSLLELKNQEIHVWSINLNFELDQINVYYNVLSLEEKQKKYENFIIQYVTNWNKRTACFDF
ncbi:hypothetical protein, partial [uncultured Algibacter sp.]|uniref:hypothetical protein n=1 Tax=uncultured Algibacter sp. TaxID=298659 RepID=UPI0026231A47